MLALPDLKTEENEVSAMYCTWHIGNMQQMAIVVTQFLPCALCNRILSCILKNLRWIPPLGRGKGYP